MGKDQTIECCPKTSLCSAQQDLFRTREGYWKAYSSVLSNCVVRIKRRLQDTVQKTRFVSRNTTWLPRLKFVPPAEWPSLLVMVPVLCKHKARHLIRWKYFAVFLITCMLLSFVRVREPVKLPPTVWYMYVLEPGFPLTRSAPSSEKYDPESAHAHILKVNGTIPWFRTQSWLSANATVQAIPTRYRQCQKLLSRDTARNTRVDDAAKFMRSHFRMRKDDFSYIRDTRDCTSFVRKRGYIMDASPKEKEMPIAFSILFYKDTEQMERFLRSVYRPHNHYCLHLDSKSPPSMRAAVHGIASCLDNVFLASSAVRVKWGTFSVLEPELICMRDLWPYKTWRYFINLTGQEYPLKTNLQLVDILTALNGSNDIDGTTYSRESVRWFKHLPAPHGIEPVKGNVHVAATRGLVDYVLHSQVVRDLLVWLNQTAMPDETFFASLNHNPHLQVPGSYLGPPDTDAAVNPYLSRFKNWGFNWLDGKDRTIFNWPCHGKRVRSICIFGIRDLPLLVSRKEMFVNKLHVDFQPLALDCLEEWLWNMTMDEYSGRTNFDTSFYRNVDKARNHVTVTTIL